MVKVKSNIQTSSIYLRLRIEQIDERTQGRAQNNPQKRYKRQCLIHFGHFPNPGVPDFHELLLTIRMCHKLKTNKAIIQRRKKREKRKWLNRFTGISWYLMAKSSLASRSNFSSFSFPVLLRTISSSSRPLT